MLPQEIRELGQDNEIVTLENTKPIFCKKIKYYEDPVFTKRDLLLTVWKPSISEYSFASD